MDNSPFYKHKTNKSLMESEVSDEEPNSMIAGNDGGSLATSMN